MKHFKMMWLLCLVGFFVSLPSVLGESGGSGPPAVEKRVALLIGNGAYIGENLGVLNNPTHDADDLANTLKEFGFDVQIQKNLKKSAMDEAIVQFGRRASHAHAALFYFAGHGLQIKGQNYLMPIDATANSEAAISYEGVNVNYILEEMENARSSVNMVMLDACRNNTFSGQFRGGKLRGLAPPASVPKGTVIVYATDPGNVASDGEGKNGLFTAGLLAGFRDKDLSLDGVLTTASKYVEEKSAREQTPYVNGPQTVMKQFQFRADKGGAMAGPATPAVKAGTAPGGVAGQADREALFWQSAQGDVEICQEYLKKYPQGEFVVPAKRCVEKGKSPAPVSSPSLPPPPAPAGTGEPRLEPMDREMVAGRLVQIQESADVRGKPVRGLEPGEKVRVLGRTSDNKWYWVEVKTWLWTKTGYVIADSLVDQTAWEETKRKPGGEQKPREESDRAVQEMQNPAQAKKENSRKSGAAEAGTGQPVPGELPAKEKAVVVEEGRVPEEKAKADFGALSEAIAQMQVGQPVSPRSAPVQSPPAAPAVAAAPDADDGTILLWQRQVQGRIYEHWNKPSGLPNENSLAVTVLVAVDPAGSLVNPRVGRSSGNSIFDQSVIRAIQKAATVEPFPAGCLECRELEITFRPVRP